MKDQHIVITIGREFYSGGQRVAKKLSEDLGIKVYDEDLMNEAAKDSGFSKELFESQDEKPTNSFLYSLVMDTYSFGYGSNTYSDMPLNHKVFLALLDTIRHIAENESCIILGRCADYALEEMEECTSVFLCADFDERVKTVQNLLGLTPSKAKDRVRKEDKARSSYYNFYTDKKWGSASGYDLCINTGVLGIEGSAKLIEHYIEERYK